MLAANSAFKSIHKDVKPTLSIIGFNTAGAISGMNVSVHGSVDITKSTVLLFGLDRHFISMRLFTHRFYIASFLLCS